MSQVQEELLQEKKRRDDIRATFLAEASAHSAKRHTALLPFSRQCREMLLKTEHLSTISPGRSQRGSDASSSSPTRRGGTNLGTPRGSFKMLIDMSSAVEDHQSARMNEKVTRLKREVQHKKLVCKGKDLLLLELTTQLEDVNRSRSLSGKMSEEITELTQHVTEACSLAKSRIAHLEKRFSLDYSDQGRSEGDLKLLQGRVDQLAEEHDSLGQQRRRLEDELRILRHSEIVAPAAARGGSNFHPLDIPTTLSDGTSSDYDDGAIDDVEMEDLVRRREDTTRRLAAAKLQRTKDRQIALPVAETDVALMSETMLLMESTVVLYRTDLKRMALIKKMTHNEKEQKFKSAHNEVKVALGFVLSGEEAKLFNKGRQDQWPVTPAMIEESFPEHKLTTVLNALKDMVITWDGLPSANKKKLSTARNVICNAPLLFFLSRYVVRMKDKKMKSRMQRVLNVQPSSPNLVLNEKDHHGLQHQIPVRRHASGVTPASFGLPGPIGLGESHGALNLTNGGLNLTANGLSLTAAGGGSARGERAGSFSGDGEGSAYSSVSPSRQGSRSQSHSATRSRGGGGGGESEGLHSFQRQRSQQ